MMMRDLFILNATLRKNIKNSVVLFLISTPLMAAETITLKNSDSLLSSGSTDTCYKTLCIEVREDKKMPDMFKKPDRFDQRERIDPGSAYDFDHSDKDIGLSISY
jgi:hypothetical protein